MSHMPHGESRDRFLLTSDGKTGVQKPGRGDFYMRCLRFHGRDVVNKIAHVDHEQDAPIHVQGYVSYSEAQEKTAAASFYVIKDTFSLRSFPPFSPRRSERALSPLGGFPLRPAYRSSVRFGGRQHPPKQAAGPFQRQWSGDQRGPKRRSSLQSGRK